MVMVAMMMLVHRSTLAQPSCTWAAPTVLEAAPLRDDRSRVELLAFGINPILPFACGHSFLRRPGSTRSEELFAQADNRQTAKQRQTDRQPRKGS